MSVEGVPETALINMQIAGILIGARDMMKDISTPQFVDLVHLCMKTHAWCVREEYNNNLKVVLSHAPIDEKVLAELHTLANTERREHAKLLENYVTSLIASTTKH